LYFDFYLFCRTKTSSRFWNLNEVMLGGGTLTSI
jgi:hypothetical protein